VRLQRLLRRRGLHLRPPREGLCLLVRWRLELCRRRPSHERRLHLEGRWLQWLLWLLVNVRSHLQRLQGAPRRPHRLHRAECAARL